MDLFDVVRICVRRWYVLIPLLLITAWFTYSAYVAVKPVYWANTIVGLTPPSTRIDNAPQGVPIPRNGLMDVGGASLVANMTVLALKQPAVVERVVEAGGLPTYGSQMFPTPATMAPLPLVWIEMTDADPVAVTKTLELVVQQTDVVLKSLQQQAGVPEDQMVTPFVVSPPSAPAKGMPSRTRSTISIFAAGTGLSIVAAVLVDVVMSKRRGKRQKSSKSASVDASGGADGTVTDESTPSINTESVDAAPESR